MIEGAKRLRKKQKTALACKNCGDTFGNQGSLQNHYTSCKPKKYGRAKALTTHNVSLPQKPASPSSSSKSSVAPENSSQTSKSSTKRRRSLEKKTSKVRTAPPKKKRLAKKSRKRYKNIRKLELLIALEEHLSQKKLLSEFEEEHNVSYKTVAAWRKKRQEIRRDATDANPKVLQDLKVECFSLSRKCWI